MENEKKIKVVLLEPASSPVRPRLTHPLPECRKRWAV